MLFGEAGLLSAYKASQENARLSARIQLLEGENARLLHDIESVQKSARRLEHTIRLELVFSRAGRDSLRVPVKETV